MNIDLCRIMGLDLGERRIGVAVSDPLGLTAQGVTVIQRRDHENWLEYLDSFVEEYQIDKIVVGLPRNMDGTISSRGRVCQQMVEVLKDRYHIPVHLWDERLSTVAIERTLITADISRQKRKKVIDQMAAAWILQGFLDANRRSS